MSHFTQVRTSLRDADVLAEALHELGYPEVEVHRRPQRIHGFGSQTREAEVIVRREHITGPVYADIGFARQDDGSFAAVMDSSDMNRYGRDWMPRLTHAYGHAAALRYARAHGYEVVTDELDATGERRLMLRRYV